MDARFQRLRSLFDAALGAPEGSDAFAARACADDPTLREELQRLLRRHHAGDETRNPFQLDHGVLETLAAGHLAPGLCLGTFRLESEIGSGGMGRIFRAVREDGEVVQEVAIKLLRPELINPALLKRFSIERQLLAQLKHPGICRLIDAGSLPGVGPYVVMELIHGQPLLEYCDAAGLNLRQRLELFRQVLSAVAHAHRHLVVHRDLKSSNVLVDSDGRPRLLDFGIAKPLVAGPDATATVTAERFFTPHHAAPEQIQGKPIGIACDIYSLGTMLYELQCGRPPFDFDGLSAGEVEQRILLHPPPPLPARVGTLASSSRALPSRNALKRVLQGDPDAIVQRCLRKDPQDRYRSVEQLNEDLNNLLDHRPIRARRNDRWYRARKFLQRHRTASTLSALLLVALGFNVAIVRQNLAIAKQRDRAQATVMLLKRVSLAADSSRSGGGDVSAWQVLEATRQRQPAVYATLAGTAAEVELALGVNSSLDEHTAAKARLDAAGKLAPGWTLEWRLAQARLPRHRAAPGAVAIPRAVVAEISKRPPDDELATQACW